MNKETKIEARCSHDFKKLAEKQAEKRGMTLSKHIRALVYEHEDRREK